MIMDLYYHNSSYNVSFAYILLFYEVKTVSFSIILGNYVRFLYIIYQITILRAYFDLDVIQKTFLAISLTEFYTHSNN